MNATLRAASVEPNSNEVDALTHAARMHGVLVRGSSFGVYVVGDCIGEGGMARVYQAEHEGLRRQVALKVLSNGFARDPEGRERFVREARMAAAIKHPNVVNIFDVGVHQDIPYLVMELLEGTDLETLLQNEGGPLSESMILDIMVPVVAGLIAVHDAGIVHRDLKPGNIFLARGRYEELEPKLLDFGVSKVAGPEQLKLTTRGLVGTPFYISPEGLRGEEMTPLADQYSLGVLMYECATARAPFSASTLPELMRVISEGEYILPQVHNPNLSKRLVRIITKAMSLDPAQRYKDLRELGRELLFLAGQRTRITWGLSFGDATTHQAPAADGGSIAPSGGTVPPPAERSSIWRKAAVGAILTGALVTVLLFLLFPTKQPEEAAQKPSASASGSGVAAFAAPVVQAVLDAPGTAPSTDSRNAVNDKSSRVDKASRAEKASAQGHPRRAAGAGRPRATDADDGPEWALPPVGSSAAQARPSPNGQAPGAGLPTGTNGAPIFD